MKNTQMELGREKNRFNISKKFLKINSKKMNNFFPVEIKNLKLYSSDDYNVHGQKYLNIYYTKQDLKKRIIKKSTRISGANTLVFI